MCFPRCKLQIEQTWVKEPLVTNHRSSLEMPRHGRTLSRAEIDGRTRSALNYQQHITYRYRQ